MKFRDIKPFTRDGNYSVQVSLSYLEKHLADWASAGNLDLDPDFQRAHVWDEARQVAFVEYLLRGGKASREIRFNCAGWMHDFHGTVELVDGKQRLEACLRFLRGEIPAFGYVIGAYEDRPNLLQGLTFYVNDLETRREVLQWYLDLNTGGVVHTSDEIEKVKKLLEVA